MVGMVARRRMQTNGTRTAEREREREREGERERESLNLMIVGIIETMPCYKDHADSENMQKM